MNYLGEKLNTVTGEALSSINELKRKREKRQRTIEIEAVEDGALQTESSNIGLQSRRFYARPSAPGIPFGGDTFAGPPPPPIGFRTDLIGVSGKDAQPAASIQPDAGNWHRQPGAQFGGQREPSEESLYDGDAWTRLWFQRVMILSLIRLMLFVRKVYEDFLATKTYRIQGQAGHFLISAAALFLPTIVFTIYRVCRYLQIALPSLRQIRPPVSSTDASKESNNPKALKASELESEPKNSEDFQVRKALMATGSGGLQQSEDDGLVTARETPTNLEDYHDSISQQNQTIGIDLDGNTSPAPSTAIVKDSPDQPKRVEQLYKETVNIDKFGNLPDKETTRVTIGASEQILHGVLFIFWQLKRQVDVLGYLVERSCLWRKPREREKEELGRLRIGSDGLEWFQDFYAAFLAILAQVYTLGLYWSTGENYKSSRATTLNSASSLGGALSAEAPGLPNVPRAVSALNQQLAGGSGLQSKDLFVMSELIVSSAVVLSLLIAVRRRDDGPLTLGLSMLGWGSIFASRVIIIALAFVHIGWQIMLGLVILHILGITGWIYKIAIDSHNGKKGESEESTWEPEGEQSIELEAEPKQDKSQDNNSSTVTSEWSILEHVILLAQILTLFALPSLFYWPIMFNLKLHYRPFKYLVLILSENFILITAIWLPIASTVEQSQWYLIGMVGGFSIAGFIFISLYVSCKPSLTEYFARADELFNDADNSGIYYEFCSRVFKLPDLGKHSFRRLMNQTEQVETIDV